MLRLVPCLLGLAVSALGAPPTMPKEYTASLVMRMPYIPLSMPLTVLTSDKAQRIEHFDGLEIDTSIPDGIYKYTFNNSVRVCIYSPPQDGPMQLLKDDPNGPWKPSQFLPDLSQYTDEGEDVIDGILCNKFTQHVGRGGSGFMDDKNVFWYDSVLNKPFRWHMHSRAQPFDSHTDEYFIDYISFQAGPPSATAIALPTMCHNPVLGEVSERVGSFLKATSALNTPAGAYAPQHFEAYLKQHGKAYAADEHAMRKDMFTKNMAMVDELNRRHAGLTTFKVNQFMDMTRAEIRSFRGLKSKTPRSQRRSAEQQKFVRVHETIGEPSPPTDFDWRRERPGAIGPVKDQAMCGSCWTYGVTEPIESGLSIQTRSQLVILPEQFVLDCTWTNDTGDSGSNNGCDGGDSDIGALEIVRKYDGIIPTAKAYGSYLATNGYCKDTRLMEIGAKITGWVDVPDRDQTAVMDALIKMGPLSIGIQVPDEMLYYESGVFNANSCAFNETNIDHAVVLAGYGTDKGADYWLVRNSWSTYWGDRGYIHIARGDNDCCVSCQSGYPSIAPAATVTQSVVV